MLVNGFTRQVGSSNVIIILIWQENFFYFVTAVNLFVQVLKFEAYFQEPVVENANENYRIRKCIVFYYLEDDTIHIIEPRV